MFLYISERKVSSVLSEKKAFRLAEQVFRLVAQKKTRMPAKIYLEMPDKSHGDFRAMPAFIQNNRDKICGVKWVSVFTNNSRLGLPTVNGVILLNSPVTGELLAVLQANTITAARTAAAAAVASRYLANPKPRKLAIVGAGLQAEHQLRAHAAQFRFQEIGVWGYKPHEAENFCRKFAGLSRHLRAFSEIKDCVENADILITCTPSVRPLVRDSWVKRGAHINAIGADAKGKEELEPSLLLGSKVVVDEWEQASHSGEINVPVSRGIFSRKNVYAELAEIVCGKKKGRGSRSEITLFDSTGLAILDIYFAKHVYNACR